MFPNSQRINRGGHVIKDIVDACRNNEVTDLIILHEHRGQPGRRDSSKENKAGVIYQIV